MKIGTKVWHPTHGELIITSKKYSPAGNKISIVAKDLQGKTRILDGTESTTQGGLPTSISATIFKGDKGDRGEKGDKGDRGDKGYKGDTGDKGLRGLQGDKGDTGKQGEQGPKGDKGDRGFSGVNGKDGKNGKDGIDIKPSEIARKIESLKGDERLDAMALKNLPKGEITRLWGGGDSYTGQVKVDTADIPGNLEDKIIAGSNITITKTAGRLSIAGSAGSGSGDVVGPASAVNNNIAVFDSTTGKLIKDGGATIASKQDTLVSGTNIKTINSTSLLGSGDIVISGSVSDDVSFTPSGGLSAINVQDALVELDTEKAPLASPTFTGSITANAGMVFEDATAVTQPRIHLKSRKEWSYPSHDADLIRLQWMNEYFKAAIAFMDMAGDDKVAIVGHDYLASYNAALDKTFTTANINTTTDVITLTGHGWNTSDAVWFSISSYKTVDMPDGIFPFFRYYIRAITADTIAIYRSSSDASSDVNRLSLDNGNASATFTITKNNLHHHVSTEVSDKSGVLGSSGQLHTRSAYNYDIYPSVLRHVDVEVHVVDQALKMLSDGNSEILFGVAPDRTGRRFSIQRHNASGELRIAHYTSDGMSASAAMQIALANGFIGIGGSPDASTYRLKLTGAAQITGALNVGGALTGVGMTMSGESHVLGNGNGTETTLWVKSNNAAGTRAGVVRITGEGTGDTYYRGGFIAYDPLNNYLIIGTHDASDTLSSSDIESIKINRADGNITLNKPVYTASTIDLGHASDTTLSRVSAGVVAVEGVTVPTISSTSTLTNKRITPRVLSATSYTTDTGTSLNCDNLDQFIVTAQSGALKLNNPTGTPTDGQKLLVAITGTAARALTYDTQFEASTVALPTTTVTTARLNIGFIWRADTSKWVCIASC